MATTWACASDPFEHAVPFSFRLSFSSQWFQVLFSKFSKIKLKIKITMQVWLTRCGIWTWLLQDIVSVPISITIFHGFDFHVEFSWTIFQGHCSHYLRYFQKWPQVDISPVQSLLVVFTCEKWMRKMVMWRKYVTVHWAPNWLKRILTQHSR